VHGVAHDTHVDIVNEFELLFSLAWTLSKTTVSN
jgi:hypothetical protein